jgi:hypothetical protein
MMLRKLLIAAALAPIIAAVAGLGVLLGQGWTDTQSSSGTVTISSNTPDMLYICEPTGPGSEPCPGDDSGPDEMIFELDESLLPGGPEAEWRIRLRNISDLQWDVSDWAVVFTETADPGNDCDTTPRLAVTTVTADDDHAVSFPPTFSADDASGIYRIHVEPNGEDDMRLVVWIPGSFPGECRGNAWDLNIAWTADGH